MHNSTYRTAFLAIAVLASFAALAVRLAATRRSPHARTQIPIPPTPMPFEEVGEQAGIRFRYDNGRKGMATILEESGSGCALLDYNGDGLLDIYLLNGRDLYGRGIRLQNALYRNNGDGSFTDVTDEAGVPGTGYGIGAAVGDYDNDGRPDLYLCQWGRNVLYHNEGGGRFKDVTDRARVAAMDYGCSFHTGAAWIDYDGDGRLDLFACSYVRFRPDGLRYCKLANGILSNCPPSAYDGSPSILYHNNGDGVFTNVTERAGIHFPGGKALSAITCDANSDGRTDLIVGNDGEEAWLLENQGGGRFRNVAQERGIAWAQDGATMAAMGIDLGDYRNEGRPGFFVADFSKRPDHLWRADERGFFSEVSTPSGVADSTFQWLGFGAGFLDYNNDGWLDLFVANGHVYPEVEFPGTDERYLQRNQLLRNRHDGTFEEVTSRSGPAFALLHAGRGAAFGDLFNRGLTDVLVSTNDGPALLLRNTGAGCGRFLSLRLEGVRSNRDAVGARVRIEAGGIRQMREVRSGGSYLSSSDRRLLFGLGGAQRVEKLSVTWPSGLKQSFGPLESNRFYTLREGAAAPLNIPDGRNLRGEK